MIEVRCSNNRKLAEIDPDAIAFTVKCRTCTDVWKRPVSHPVPIGKILNAIGSGMHDGVIYVDGDALQDDHGVH